MHIKLEKDGSWTIYTGTGTVIAGQVPAEQAIILAAATIAQGVGLAIAAPEPPPPPPLKLVAEA